MAETEQQLPEQQSHVLRGYELRFLRCTLVEPTSDHHSSSPSSSTLLSSGSPHCRTLHAHINKLLNLIEAGNYIQALYSDAAELLVAELPELAESPDGVCSDLVDRVVWFVANNRNALDNEERACRVILVLCVAVAALFCFTQCNITGPVVELPACPLPFKGSEGVELQEWDDWARKQVISDGSDLLGKFSNIQYIVFAKMLVMRTKDLLFDGDVASIYGIRSISWWLARILIIEQRILEERSSSLFDLLQVSMGEALNHFGTLEKVTSYWGAELHDGEASALVSMVHLEAGIMENSYGRVDSCRLHFEMANVAADIQLSMTGVLGFRTEHQVEPKAQMVLVANRSSLTGGSSCSSAGSVIQEHDPPNDGANLHQYHKTSHILMTPKLLENNTNSGINALGSGGPGATALLKPIQQAAILASCLLVEKSSRHDEMLRWEMAPFIEAVDSQPSLFFILKCFCNLLRIRWESTRSHTKGRALEMMENLVEGVHKPFPGVAQRIPLCYVAYMPSIASLKKEYGELLVSFGLIGEAMKIFEALELWDNLIYCSCLLGKKAEAVELIKKRISEMPNDPKLWCMLGDATNNDSCYEKALEVSSNRSARAKRSLARSAYNKGDYEASKELWESAMAMNSMYTDGWFALGAAALKARDVDKALEGFTRAVKQDPENGEAWNNIACLHMVKRKNKEAFIAFQQALKLKRGSWQMWENYSHVAMDVGNIRQALEAIQMVLRLTSCKKVDAELLERIMLEMEQKISEVEKSRETEQLLELLGKVLQQIVSNGSGGDNWGLYARWHKIRGDLMMCSEALLKQVRSYQGLDLWKDRDRFKKFAQASLELCKVYVEISSSTGSRRELLSAEMHLKNVIRQAESFSDTKEFEDLQIFLLEVKAKLQSIST